MNYGEPWRIGDIRGAVVTDEFDSAMHCCHRAPAEDKDCHDAYGGWLVFESATLATAERIMLCVNALAGVSNESLRAHSARGGYARAIA